MANRQEELSQLKSFIGKVDTELTMILQHLQWDRKRLIEAQPLVSCKYDENHRVPEGTQDIHEQQCLLTKNGYSKEDVMLPDPLDPNANTLIKYSKIEIKQIIDRAAGTDPCFKRGVSSTQAPGGTDLQPLTVARLQATYSPDERRAIYDAVVAAAPFSHDLAELALPSENGEGTSTKQKTRVEILAELRDMRRRRTKYRVAAPTRNYSHELREVIKTQMEVYTNVKVEDTYQVRSLSKTKETLSRKDGHTSKYPTISRGNTQFHSENNSDKRHQREEFRDRSDVDNGSSSKRRRANDFVQYPDPRKYKQDRYNNDDGRSRHNLYVRDDNTDKEKYSERKYKEKRSYDRSSTSSTMITEIKQEPETDDEYYKGKYKESRDRHESKHRYEEKDYRKEKYGKSREQYESDRRYKDSRKYEKRKEDKYKSERRDEYSKRDEKHEKYYDEYEKKIHKRYSEY